MKPDLIGYYDASGLEAGGVLFLVQTLIEPIVWNFEFSELIKKAIDYES